MHWYKMIRWDWKNQVGYIKESHWQAFKDMHQCGWFKERSFRQLIHAYPSGLMEVCFKAIKDEDWAEPERPAEEK